MKRILLVVGTRPNYIKITQFKAVALAKFPNTFDIKIVHTGQHYDKEMASDFFDQLKIHPDFVLEKPTGTPNTQIGKIMLGLEEVINQFLPDLIMVPGDVNSTLAAALTANKMNIPLAHVESGLRSFDRTMPEEVNRILVDELSDIFFVTEKSGIDNLLNEGKKPNSMYLVGNTMIDTLIGFDQEINAQTVLKDFDLIKDSFILMTIHRPSNVDSFEGLNRLIELISNLTKTHVVVFPMHPRTKTKAIAYKLYDRIKGLSNLVLLPPLDYFKFQNLIKNAKLVITDSGGIQEETTYLKKPCLTLRLNTERPITLTSGTNTLLEFDLNQILEQVEKIENGTYKVGQIPQKWDGKATERILSIVSKYLN